MNGPWPLTAKDRSPQMHHREPQNDHIMTSVLKVRPLDSPPLRTTTPASDAEAAESCLHQHGGTVHLVSPRSGQAATRLNRGVRGKGARLPHPPPGHYGSPAAGVKPVSGRVHSRGLCDTPGLAGWLNV